MDDIVKAKMEGMKFGDVLIHQHVAVIPIISTNGNGMDYLTMKEALEGHVLRVTEVTEGGHVPELKVTNSGTKPVLLLDGEEVSGAKQNRVLNTTILLRENSETIIPVSCTEHGRWSYRSHDFEESGHIMPAAIRQVKNVSVSMNLRSERSYMSDQGAVWDEIADRARVNEVRSSTGAMKDVFESRQQDLDAFLEHFPPVADQNGLLVCVNGKVVGLDVISRPEAFAVLHPKLIQSYVMDALTERPIRSKRIPSEQADAFLKRIPGCREEYFESVGYGRDYRYEGKKIVGSALVHEGNVIHVAFFQTAESQKAGHMSSVSRRKAYGSNK